MKSSLFPPMNPAQEAKVKRLLDMIGEYMDAPIAIESVISMKVAYPDDRPDVEAIIKRLCGNKTGLVKKNTNITKPVDHSSDQPGNHPGNQQGA